MLTITIERQELSKMVRDVKEQSGRRKGWVRCFPPPSSSSSSSPSSSSSSGRAGSGARAHTHLIASSFDFNYSPLFKMSFQPATRRIFPTNETWNNYGALLEYSSSNNLILHENLFPDVLMKPANRVHAQICQTFLLI